MISRSQKKLQTIAAINRTEKTGFFGILFFITEEIPPGSYVIKNKFRVKISDSFEIIKNFIMSYKEVSDENMLE